MRLDFLIGSETKLGGEIVERMVKLLESQENQIRKECEKSMFLTVEWP